MKFDNKFFTSGFSFTGIMFMVIIIISIICISCVCFPPLIPCKPTPTPTPMATMTPTPQIMPTNTPTSIPTPKTVLSIQGKSFYVNGEKTFLLMASYYGALGTTIEQIKSDLLFLKSKGFNSVRVWIGWNRCSQNASVFDLHLKWVPVIHDKLVQLLDFTDEQGMIVDLTMHYCNQNDWGSCCNASDERTCDQPFVDCDKPSEPARTLPVMQSLWEQMTILTKRWRHIYFDLSNEHDVGDFRFISPLDVLTLVNAVKAIDPDRIVTCSGTNTDHALIELIDFLAPHLARGDDPWLYTCPWLTSILPFALPVMLQEPFRNGYGGDMYEWWEFCEDLIRALTCLNPAAGWCWHNDACFYLHEQNFVEQIDSSEMEFLNRIDECMTRTSIMSGLEREVDTIPDFGPYYDGAYLEIRP